MTIDGIQDGFIALGGSDKVRNIRPPDIDSAVETAIERSLSGSSLEDPSPYEARKPDPDQTPHDSQTGDDTRAEWARTRGLAR